MDLLSRDMLPDVRDPELTGLTDLSLIIHITVSRASLIYYYMLCKENKPLYNINVLHLFFCICENILHNPDQEAHFIENLQVDCQRSAFAKLNLKMPLKTFSIIY